MAWFEMLAQLCEGAEAHKRCSTRFETYQNATTSASHNTTELTRSLVFPEQR